MRTTGSGPRSSSPIRARTHVIIAGVTIGTCCSMPTLSRLNDGYQVFPVVDACAAWNEYEAQAAIARMTGPARSR